MPVLRVKIWMGYRYGVGWKEPVTPTPLIVHTSDHSDEFHNRSARTPSDIEIGTELTSIFFYATHGLVRNPINEYVIEKKSF